MASCVHCETAAGVARAVTELLKIDSHFVVSAFMQAVYFKVADVREQLAADLHAAGLPA